MATYKKTNSDPYFTPYVKIKTIDLNIKHKTRKLLDENREKFIYKIKNWSIGLYQNYNFYKRHAQLKEQKW